MDPPRRPSDEASRRPSASGGRHRAPSSVSVPSPDQPSLPPIRHFSPYVSPTGLSSQAPPQRIFHEHLHQSQSQSHSHSLSPTLPTTRASMSSSSRYGEPPPTAVRPTRASVGSRRSPDDGPGDLPGGADSDMDIAPSGDPLDPQAPPKKKRRRQALSCTECKRRKIRCDRSQPCGPCMRRGEQDKCQWHLIEQGDKFVTRSDWDQLVSRYKSLEDRHHRLEAFVVNAHPELASRWSMGSEGTGPATGVQISLSPGSSSGIIGPGSGSAMNPVIQGPSSSRNASAVGGTGTVPIPTALSGPGVAGLSGQSSVMMNPNPNPGTSPPERRAVGGGNFYPSHPSPTLPSSSSQSQSHSQSHGITPRDLHSLSHTHTHSHSHSTSTTTSPRSSTIIRSPNQSQSPLQPRRHLYRASQDLGHDRERDIPPMRRQSFPPLPLASTSGSGSGPGLSPIIGGTSGGAMYMPSHSQALGRFSDPFAGSAGRTYTTPSSGVSSSSVMFDVAPRVVIPERERSRDLVMSSSSISSTPQSTQTQPQSRYLPHWSYPYVYPELRSRQPRQSRQQREQGQQRQEQPQPQDRPSSQPSALSLSSILTSRPISRPSSPSLSPPNPIPILPDDPSRLPPSPLNITLSPNTRSLKRTRGDRSRRSSPDQDRGQDQDIELNLDPDDPDPDPDPRLRCEDLERDLEHDIEGRAPSRSRSSNSNSNSNSMSPILHSKNDSAQALRILGERLRPLLSNPGHEFESDVSSHCRSNVWVQDDVTRLSSLRSSFWKRRRTGCVMDKNFEGTLGWRVGIGVGRGHVVQGLRRMT